MRKMQLAETLMTYSCELLKKINALRELINGEG
jgi:hypothetical protein